METISWTERCDCYEKYGRCMHSNGGNYHRVVRATVLECGLLIEDTDTREWFSGDRAEYIVRDAESFYHVWEFDHDVIKEAGLEVVYEARKHDLVTDYLELGDYSAIRPRLASAFERVRGLEYEIWAVED